MSVAMSVAVQEENAPLPADFPLVRNEEKKEEKKKKL
jgi:hypothetical protein